MSFPTEDSKNDAALIEYVSEDDVVAQPKKFGTVAKTVLIIASFTVGTYIGEMIFDSNSSNADTVVENNDNEIITSHEITGLTLSDAETKLDNVGIYDITVDSDNVEHNGETIVQDAHIGNDTAEIILTDHPVEVINSLNIEGMRWPDAEKELTQAGLLNHEDYVLYTDHGEMYYANNWAVDYIDTTEEGVARIVVTNEGLGNLQEGINDGVSQIGEGAQELLGGNE